MKRVTSAASFPSSRSSTSTAAFAAVPLSHFLSTASDSAKTASTTSARAAALTRRRRRLGFAVSVSKQGKATCSKQLWPDLSFSLYLPVVNSGGVGHEVPVYEGVDLFLMCLVVVEVNLFRECLVTCCIFQACLAGLVYHQAVTGHS